MGWGPLHQKGSMSKHSHILRPSGLGLQHRTFGGNKVTTLAQAKKGINFKTTEKHRTKVQVITLDTSWELGSQQTATLFIFFPLSAFSLCFSQHVCFGSFFLCTDQSRLGCTYTDYYGAPRWWSQPLSHTTLLFSFLQLTDSGFMSYFSFHFL